MASAKGWMKICQMSSVKCWNEKMSYVKCWMLKGVYVQFILTGFERQGCHMSSVIIWKENMSDFKCQLLEEQCHRLYLLYMSAMIRAMFEG